MCVCVSASAEIMTICKRVLQAAEQAKGDEDTEIADKGERRGGRLVGRDACRQPATVGGSDGAAQEVMV